MKSGLEFETSGAGECEKKGWHKPAVTSLDFDRTALTSIGGPCDSGCCCCSYTPS